MTGLPLDDEDDDPRARPTLTHAPRGTDVFADSMRTALRSVQAAHFAGNTPFERVAARRVEQCMLDEFATLGLSLYG